MSAITRILLIDDNEDTRLVVEGLLASAEYDAFELEWVPSSAAALEQIARQPAYDLYLIDYYLEPGQPNGLDLVRELVAGQSTVPMIMLTSERDRALDRAAMQAGVVDYLEKGALTPPLLERAIRYAIERAHTLKALRESEARYALAIKGANDGVWDWDLITNNLYVSPRWKSMLGYPEQEIIASPEAWFDMIHPEDCLGFRVAIDDHLAGHSTHLEYEYRIRRRDGGDCWVLCRGSAVQDPHGRSIRMAGSQTDMTKRKVLEAQLLHDALHDRLTGLPNRALFMERLEQIIAHARRHKERLFAVFFLDLDGFKVVNDSLGHLAGDQLLVEVARRLMTHLRSSDTVARFGGDEFAILIHDFKAISDLPVTARRLQQHISMPIYLDKRAVSVTVSIGITVSTTNYDNPEDMLRDADIAMYRAKALGRARHEMFDVTMHARAMQRLNLEVDLREAIEQQHFELHYQPIVHLATRQVVAVEVLVRWRHLGRGLIAPSDFLPIAEETGLIIPLGRWILLEACRQVRQWQLQFPHYAGLTLSINLSNKQFWHPDLISMVVEAIEQTGLSAHALHFEITEGVIMEQIEDAMAVIRSLCDLSVDLQIDDFGTGYSSLEALHRLPIEALKIDRSFVGRLHEDIRGKEIVRAIIMMGSHLGVRVIAEGVESELQCAQLQNLGCIYGQGYLFSKPLDPMAMTTLLEVTTPREDEDFQE